MIVASHEETVIDRRIANLRALDYPADRLEVVVTDASTDRTEALAVAAGSHAAHDRAVRETSAEIIAFSDANTPWAPDALRKLVRNFADPAAEEGDPDAPAR